jgi:hypothetical protein
MSTTRPLLMVALLTVFVLASPGRAAQTSSTQTQPHQHDHSTSMSAHDKHHEEVNEHGDEAMGFSHLKTTHHFRLSSSGGSIEVQTTDPGDRTSRDQIRAHLQKITAAFKKGDFSSPMMTHSRIPPGVPTMQRLKGDIGYKYAETKTGGKVLISTANSDALKAVHEFLRFQITDHRTGDPMAIRK